MIIALFGLPGVGKTTFSKKIETFCRDHDIPVVVKKLSFYVEAELGRRCTLEEINRHYSDRIQKNGRSYWASKIIQDSVDTVLVLDGVWFDNELQQFSGNPDCSYVGVYLEEERSVLYERACWTTLRKNEDIFELKRVMDIIKSFDFSGFAQYATVTGRCDQQTFERIRSILPDGASS